MNDFSFQISHIYKNIYISDIYHSNNIKELSKYNIKAILYLGNTDKSKEILNSYIKLGIDYKFLKVIDTCDSNISACFEPSWNFINQHIIQNKNILIHCRKGISRSPTIVAYFLTRKMLEHMKTKGHIEPVLMDILILMKKNRPCINPNRFFLKQLKNYENINIKSLVK